MDGKTRYILASHLARERDGKAATTVLRKALAAADKPPDAFFSDKLRSYLPALRAVIPNAKHFQSEGLDADINNNLSERLQGTFRDRIKTLRGLDNLESGQRYLDGWTITYNLFRGHHSLRNQTPGYPGEGQATVQGMGRRGKRGRRVSTAHRGGDTAGCTAEATQGQDAEDSAAEVRSDGKREGGQQSHTAVRLCRHAQSVAPETAEGGPQG